MNKLGLDIGGTKIAIALYNPEGKEIYYDRIATPKNNYNNFIATILNLINQVKKEFITPFSVGIGLPGAICPQTNTIKNSNILIINGKNLKCDIENLLNQPVSIGNDADCFALSEARFGAGQEYDSCFGAILGTGCGGGIVINKKLLSGPNHVAGEWGHNSLARYQPDRDGIPEPCYCGSHCCNESFLSGTGFAKMYNQRHQDNLSSIDIMKLKTSSDKAKHHYQLYIDQLARALSQIINTLDPDVIILGGGMSNEPSLYKDLQPKLAQYVFGGICLTSIKQAQLGDDSGAKGAAFLA